MTGRNAKEPSLSSVARQWSDHTFLATGATKAQITYGVIRKESEMCYNCGCGMPNNDMGKPDNITTRTFEDAAAAMGQTLSDARRNASQLLEKVLASKEESNEKNWRP